MNMYCDIKSNLWWWRRWLWLKWRIILVILITFGCLKLCVDCRRPILSGLLISLDFGPVYVKVQVWISNLFRYVVYLFLLSLRVILCYFVILC